MHPDLFEWRNRPETVEPWKPVPLNAASWPPPYRQIYAWRLRQLQKLRDPAMLRSALVYYATHPVEFIIHWMDTYDPRQTRTKWMPFVFFEKQAETLQFIHECFTDGESGLVEKCRDAGITWLSCAYSIWRWRFIPNDAIGWGSRKQDLVHRIGDADSIFEKIFLLLNRLPDCFKPAGYNPSDHATFMKLINPENGSIIAGEAGDNIGRGGRKSGYFKDEAAHLERPEKVEAALGDNTNTQIDISSVNGVGNVFHNRRKNGVVWHPGATIEPGFVRVQIVDWRDHPAKTQRWYDERKAKYVREGLQHVFAQEVDRNYSAAILNVLIEPEWVQAAIDAHNHIPGMDEGAWGAAMDVAGEDKEGRDRNALVKRKGVVLRFAREWGERDPGVSTRWLVADCRQHPGIAVQYDSVGLGEAVRSEFNRLVDESIVDRSNINLVPWNAGEGPQDPYAFVIPGDKQTPMNKDFFGNLKAQGWWSLRTRFYKTWQARTRGVQYAPSELISISSDVNHFQQLIDEISQPVKTQNSALKMIVDKKPAGTNSPNIADCVMMAYFPIKNASPTMIQGIMTQ